MRLFSVQVCAHARSGLQNITDELKVCKKDPVLIFLYEDDDLRDCVPEKSFQRRSNRLISSSGRIRPVLKSIILRRVG